MNETTQTIAQTLETIGALSYATGISRTDLGALITLVAGPPGGMTLSELGRRLAMSRAAITTVADRLERDRLAERVAHENDRRLTLLVPTRAGVRAVLDAMDEADSKVANT